MGKVLSYIRYIIQDFKPNFCSSKFGIFLILQFFVIHVFISPLNKFAVTMKYSISPWIAPFLFEKEYFRVFFIVGAIYYYSSVPFMQYSEMYSVIRIGRRKWGLSKIIGIIIGAYGISFMEIVLSIIPLIPNVKFELGWGKILYTLAMTDATKQFKIPFYISYEIISRNDPIKAIFLQWLISGLVVSFIGIMMFFMSIFFSRLIAICTAMIFNILSIVVLDMSYKIKNINYISPISWMDITNVGVKNGQVSFYYITTILVIIIIILSILILWRIKKIDFQWNREE